ncbi:MAG: glycosyltransferase [Deferribacteres bacterium]|nr:glycosyltransferase [Deferribacteres bacterium]
MLEQVKIGRYCCAPSTQIENFRPLVGDDMIDELRELAKDLSSIRICNINATPFGGGVAELLSREIPILKALGVQADWRIIHGDQEFFSITKSFHNAIQGQEFELTDDIKDIYIRHNRKSAELLTSEYDVFIVHDPQPAALRYFNKHKKGKWIWRCHIDSSAPDEGVWNFIKPYVESYDAVVFTLKEFVPPGLKVSVQEYILPAIDPFSSKNMELPGEVYRNAVANSGVDLKRPLIVQVSRFDPWKDPLGVIQAYQLVKREKNDVQLAMIGSLAGDDPEGYEILSRVNEESSRDPDIYVFTNLEGVGNMEVNSFQRAADVVIQKSIREGFGLVVSEALWKETPVVAGNVGGIRTQIPEEMQGFLVSSVEGCAASLLRLLNDSPLRREFGKKGREKVRKEFLYPRMIRDNLRLVKRIISS